jgi:hypothetical protein
VVVVKAGDSMRLYLNGRLAGEKAEPWIGQMRGSVAKTHFGFNETINPRPLDGFLDDVAIYDRALSNEEVRNHHEATNQRF